ncbi:MAG TPA: hypothetical protein VG604_03225 [Candidatus Saccharimonadales bacterium]|nr:hypothetical protein [Candidatus Saccharimonadales bacterium]
MDPENKTGLQLPTPVAEQVPGAAPGQSPESAAGGPESSAGNPPVGMPSGQSASPMAVGMSLPAVPAAPQNDVTVTTQISTPTVADDGDLIEKEWVEKAKKIVESNREDPYKQSEELTVVKAEYMQKRYNKTVKLK